jgi:hypothetical protein
MKMFFPAAGIPIEVGKRLYEIYRDRKQLPNHENKYQLSAPHQSG